MLLLHEKTATFMSFGSGLGTHLFVKVPRPGDSEVAFSAIESSKGRSNSVKCLAQGHNKRTCRPISTLTVLNAERQAGKL